MSNNALIGYQSFTSGASISATSETPGFEADSVLNELTYEKWKPTSTGATITIDMGGIKAIDYIAIAAHTLGSTNKLVSFSYSTNGTSYTQLSARYPPNDRAIFDDFTQVSARYVRIQMSGGTELAVIGVIYIGQYLEMYRPIYGGHTPIVLSRKTTTKNNISESGQWLGRSIVRQGLISEFNWRHTPINWYEQNIDPLSKHAQTKPFFIKWRPDDYSQQVAYVIVDDDIKPTLMGIRNLCEFGFTVRGIE